MTARRRGALGFGSILGLDLTNPRSWERSQIGESGETGWQIPPSNYPSFLCFLLISEAVEEAASGGGDRPRAARGGGGGERGHGSREEEGRPRDLDEAGSDGEEETLLEREKKTK